jgi:hypothetical protein
MMPGRKTPWIEILGALGVVLSLVFVGYQIHENTKAVRGATVQGITDQALELNSLLISVPELRDGYWKAARGQTDLTAAQTGTLATWYAMQLRVAENRFRQRQLGTFSVDDAAVGGRSPALRLPFFRSYWKARRSFYSPDFAAFVDRELIPLVQDSLPPVVLH